MATLTRPKTVPAEQTTDLLSSTIPTPFPRSAAQQGQQRTDVQHEMPARNEGSTVSQSQNVEQLETIDHIQEIIPSVANVQTSCLLILNDLLPSSGSRRAIVPDLTDPGSSTSASHALRTLLSNLRELDDGNEMVEIAPSTDSTALHAELAKRVHHLADSALANPLDVELARSLVVLLARLDRFSVLRTFTPRNASNSSSLGSPRIDAGSDAFDTLKRSVSELQVYERTSSPSSQAPALQIESALLWSRIDSDLEHVLSICRQRSETLTPTFPPGLEHIPQHPPDYDYDDDYDYEMPPQYGDPHSPGYSDMKDEKSRFSSQQDYHVSSASAGNEKMRLDLEAVTLAIDRLYLVAPQLHNQRVELKKSKLEEMEKARAAGQSSVSKGKQKQNEMKELDDMLQLIGKASQRRMVDQSVVLEGGLEARLEKAKRRDIQKRQEFVEQLASRTGVGRLRDQDAVLNPPRPKDPEALLSLPEFIRENVPAGVQQADPETIMTLPEFMKEPVPPGHAVASPTNTSFASLKRSRSRSMSAPSLAWIFGTAPKSPSPGPSEKKSHKKRRPGTSNGSISSTSAGLDIHYVAEHHETLQHVMVFFNVTGALAGHNLEAEVYSSGIESAERLVITSGSRTTPPVSLPARLMAGKKEVRVQSGHFELKLPTAPSSSLETLEPSQSCLLDATSLTESSPTSFICSSCSLPLVQSTRVSHYKDLPSEHWEELVDAWMCHTDQKLHEHVVKHASNGFWPMEGQALVGGSYIVFEKSSVVESNICPTETKTRGDWRSVRCICGAIVGRCQKPPGEKREESMVYRLVKYAIRPVSPTAEPTRIPLSAFIVEDMQEYVHAHATYRFILHDEEEDKPRILVWLFKPNIRIAYATPTCYSMPKSGCIHAAKVLFKLLGPTADLDSIVQKYPGFPQAEHLSYPLDICHRLAALLKESNAAYPESMRQITGLEVGFLQRI